MRGKRFSEEQIIGILKEAEDGVPVPELLRKHGIAQGTFYRWKAKYGGLELSEAKRLKQLEEEFAQDFVRAHRSLLVAIAHVEALERVADDKDARAKLRALFQKNAVVSSKIVHGKDTDPEAAKFKDYFEWSEPLAKAPSHRVLAMRRGEKELFLMMRVQLADEAASFAEIQSLFGKNKSAAAEQVSLAVQDAAKDMRGA